ncbi:hypothetical protein [Paludisphaera soli]|uniref:hypothetical protein n=1 Tax=Paludisphaera soli TaxID=2712865 RepID=UPI0013E9AAD9|nr:hypothetical protein [Paludisphaera soli]
MTTKTLTVGDAVIAKEEGVFIVRFDDDAAEFDTLREAREFATERRNDLLLEKLIENAGRLGMSNPKTTARLLAAMEALKA